MEVQNIDQDAYNEKIHGTLKLNICNVTNKIISKEYFFQNIESFYFFSIIKYSSFIVRYLCYPLLSQYDQRSHYYFISVLYYIGSGRVH